jgi:hypothetical protein
MNRFFGESEDNENGANYKISDKNSHNLKGVSMKDDPCNEPLLGHQTSNFGAHRRNLHGDNAKQVAEFLSFIRDRQ